MIRSKFRCMSVTYNADQASEIRFLPVVPKCSAYPEGCEENKTFWEATPSGELKVGIEHGKEVPYTVGGFYFLDIEEATEGDHRWKLWGVTEYETNINISMGLSWSNDREMVHATLELGINNKNCWPAFLGKAGTKWSVTFIPTE